MVTSDDPFTASDKRKLYLISAKKNAMCLLSSNTRMNKDKLSQRFFNMNVVSVLFVLSVD
ncbi:hypothetical protein LSP03_20440 [Lysinibacillus sphaericus]|nr:hypothetical protein LSP03_20440 [Lysinibacillus sphaericus]